MKATASLMDFRREAFIVVALGSIITTKIRNSDW